ncbi:MAG: hypothetical protein ACRCUT_01375, partial [Spirochaetota bacterium]
MKFFFIFLYTIFFAAGPAFADTDFEELDKPPEGAYKGQILAGAFVSMGYPRGSMIDAEQDLIDGSTYTFTENETTKEIWISHLCYSFGAFAEYMPLDYLGVTARAGYSSIVQRSAFGKDYANVKGTLYRDFSFLAGPVLHATNRKPWDISLTPLAGITYGRYYAAPVARKLIKTYEG